MGLVSFDVSRVGRTTGSARGLFVTSGVHTTSASASDLTSGAVGDTTVLEVNAGDIIKLVPSQNMRMLFKRRDPEFSDPDASAHSGFIISANQAEYIEAAVYGTVSIIDA